MRTSTIYLLEDKDTKLLVKGFKKCGNSYHFNKIIKIFYTEILIGHIESYFRCDTYDNHDCDCKYFWLEAGDKYHKAKRPIKLNNVNMKILELLYEY